MITASSRGIGGGWVDDCGNHMLFAVNEGLSRGPALTSDEVGLPVS